MSATRERSGHHTDRRPGEATVRLDVMGTEATITVVGGDRARGGADGAGRLGAGLLVDLERRWTRFRPESDVVRCNRAGAQATRVHWTTRDLLLLAVASWVRTGGRFDPTVGSAMVAAGYDRTFAELERSGPATTPATTAVPRPTPGCAGIVIDATACLVTLPPGVALDLGGIGKGYAADLVAREVLDAGARGVCVNVGGDVRVAGEPPADTWCVGIEDPWQPGRSLGSIRLVDGAVAVSGITRRRWETPSGPAHHVVDPERGRPTATDVIAAAVLAGTGWWAEALTKVVLTSWASTALDDLALVGEGARAVVIDRTGSVRHDRELTPFLTAPLTTAPPPSAAPTSGGQP